MALINLEEHELDVPLYEELETNNIAVNNLDRIQLGLNVGNDRVFHEDILHDEETIYVDVPVYIRG